MKKYITIALFFLTTIATQAQSDQELNRDSVIGWQYLTNPPKANAAYKPVKSQYGGGAAYTPWQQQVSDILISWIQQSYLPRGLVMRTATKNDDRWYVDGNGPLHSYGMNFLGYEAHFVNGKIDLRCCEQGLKLQAGFNDFPGTFIKGFNPGGVYFFAEQAPFSTGDDETQLSKEGIDKKIQPSLYGYRTYLDHYHDNGKQLFRIGVVVAKNGEWPFKPVLVKDAVACIQQQLAAYPGIMQKNPYSGEPLKKTLERLKPYYNEVAKLKANINYNNAINDGNGHYLLDPETIINGKAVDKTFPEYNILVTTTQQIIDQTKTDNPLWVYFNLTPNTDFIGTIAKFDTQYGTAEQHMVYQLLNNFNFDYVHKWLSEPDKTKLTPFTPRNAPAKSSGKITTGPVTVSAAASAKNKDPYTILYEDFNGYAEGALSAKGWHTYGYDGHSFENATANSIGGQQGKWISIPDIYTFYPDFNKPLGSSFTVNYAIYFDKNSSNKRTPIYFRLDTKDPKKSNPIDLHDINREGFQFALAMSGETESNKRYMSAKQDEVVKTVRIPAFKENDVAHISISVNGAVIAVSLNGKEILRDDNAIPAGKIFYRYGWYCGSPNILLGNIYIKKQ